MFQFKTIGNYFLKPNPISVWLGNFTSEIQMEEYMDHYFESKFGAGYNKNIGYEASVELNQIEVRSLLKQYISTETILDEIAMAALQKGWKLASCIIVIRSEVNHLAKSELEKVLPIEYIGTFWEEPYVDGISLFRVLRAVLFVFAILQGCLIAYCIMINSHLWTGTPAVVRGIIIILCLICGKYLTTFEVLIFLRFRKLWNARR